MYEMKSSGVAAGAPFVDFVDPFEMRDRMEGGLGMALADVFLSCPGLCFFVGESPLPNVNGSPLPNVKVLLSGRPRLEAPESAVSSDGLGSSSKPSLDLLLFPHVDLEDFFPPESDGFFAVASPDADWPEVDRDCTVGMSSLCVRTKSAFTSSFSVRMAARWWWGMFLDS